MNTNTCILKDNALHVTNSFTLSVYLFSAAYPVTLLKRILVELES